MNVLHHDGFQTQVLLEIKGLQKATGRPFTLAEREEIERKQ